jgi:threonine dehydrogenase-like Zn-dependent dehydrogenase
VLLKVKNIDPASQKRLATAYLYQLGYAALLKGEYRPGFEVAVIGMGAIGFASASLVSVYGGAPVIFSGRINTVDLLKHIPFARFFNKTQTGSAYPSDAGLDGADLVVNTSDSWDDYELSLKIVRRGGTIVLLGFPGRGMKPPRFNPLDSKYIYDKAISIRQAGHVSDLDVSPMDLRFTLKRNLVYLYSLLISERIDPSPLLNTSFAWDKLQEAYTFLEGRPDGTLSAILDWSC